MVDMTSTQRAVLAEPTDAEALPDLFARIAAARGGVVPNLYRALAGSPDICSAWLELFTQLRQRSVVPPLLRELAMLRIAVLNRAEYEFVAHVPHARAAGASEEAILALKRSDIDTGVFDDAARAVLRYADAMTLKVQVDDATFAALRRVLEPKAVLELTVIVGGYNMVSRVLEALHIPHDTPPADRTSVI